MKIFARSKKKAALSLSMEAIVILIIAVVMLGLGLGFVRGLFSKMGDQSTKALTLSELLDPPSEEKPVTLTPSKISLQQDQKTEQVQVAFYNPSPTAKMWMVTVPDKLKYADMGISASSKPFTLGKNQITGYNIIFKARDGLVNAINGAGLPDELEATALYSIEICEVTALTATTCKANGEKYQKEVVVTVRK